MKHVIDLQATGRMQLFIIQVLSEHVIILNEKFKLQVANRILEQTFHVAEGVGDTCLNLTCPRVIRG